MKALLKKLRGKQTQIINYLEFTVKLEELCNSALFRQQKTIP